MSTCLVQRVEEPQRAPVEADGGAAALLRREDGIGQFVRFVAVGGTSMLLYGVVLWLLQGLGTQPANLVGSLASTVLANELHRRLTFHAEDRVGWFTAQWEAGGVTVVGLVATSATLGWLDTTAAGQQVALQITAVVLVTAIVGLLRFVALRWIFRRPSLQSG